MGCCQSKPTQREDVKDKTMIQIENANSDPIPKAKDVKQPSNQKKTTLKKAAKDVKEQLINFREQMRLLLTVLPGFKVVDISKIIGLKGGISCTVEFKDHKKLDEAQINKIKLNQMGKIIVAAIKKADDARQSLKESPIIFNSFTFTASIEASITLSFTPNYAALKKEVEKSVNKKKAEKINFGMKSININNLVQNATDYGEKKVVENVVNYMKKKVDNFVEQLRLVLPIIEESPFKFADFSLIIGLETGISCRVEFKGDNNKWEESIRINKDTLNNVGKGILSPIEDAYQAVQAFNHNKIPITLRSFSFQVTTSGSGPEVRLQLSFTPNNNNNDDKKEEYTNNDKNGKSAKSKINEFGKKQMNDFLEQMRLLSPTMKDSGFRLDDISVIIGSRIGISCGVQNIDNNKTWDESRLNKDKLNKMGKIIIYAMKKADEKRQKYKEKRSVFSSFNFEATNSPQLQLSFTPKDMYNKKEKIDNETNDDQKEDDNR